MPRCHSLVSCRACSGATTDVSNGSADWLRWRARLSVSSTRRRCSSRRADQYRRPGHRPLGRVTAPPPPSAIPLVSFERRFSSTFRTGSPPSPPFRFCPPALERPLLASVRRRSEPPPPRPSRWRPFAALEFHLLERFVLDLLFGDGDDQSRFISSADSRPSPVSAAASASARRGTRTEAADRRNLFFSATSAGRFLFFWNCQPLLKCGPAPPPIGAS